MKTGTLRINVKAIGVAEVARKVNALRKSVEQFYAIGKKFGIPKKYLLKMLAFQIERQSGTKVEGKDLVFQEPIKRRKL